jgi:hypothetical protein
MYSRDGWTWTEVASGFGRLAGVVADGDQLIAIDQASGATGARSWVGTITGEHLSWSPDSISDEGFSGSFLTSLVSNGSSMMAIGWERETETPFWWDRTPTGWDRHSFPEEFRGLPKLAAGGPPGFVVAGRQPSIFGGDPQIWHLENGSWVLETEAALAPLPDAAAAECSALDEDLIDLLAGGSAAWASCFGDASLTITAWMVRCDDCNEEGGPDNQQPAWLLRPTDRDVIYLSPTEGGGWDWLQGIFAPSVAYDPTWADRFASITGHFDDPASVRCRRPPAADEEIWYEGRDGVVTECRTRFVVTGVRILPDPE